MTAGNALTAIGILFALAFVLGGSWVYFTSAKLKANQEDQQRQHDQTVAMLSVTSENNDELRRQMEYDRNANKVALEAERASCREEIASINRHYSHQIGELEGRMAELRSGFQADVAVTTAKEVLKALDRRGTT